MDKLELTESGMQLAILKMVTENNGMLKTILNVLADMQSTMQVADIPEEVIDSLKKSYVDLYERMATAHEGIAFHRAVDYATNNDPDLDYPEDLIR